MVVRMVVGVVVGVRVPGVVVPLVVVMGVRCVSGIGAAVEVGHKFGAEREEAPCRDGVLDGGGGGRGRGGQEFFPQFLALLEEENEENLW